MSHLERQLSEDDDRLDLAAELLAEASTTRLPEKTSALAKMLAAVARADKPTIDVYAMLVKAIGDIDKPHVTILHLLASESPNASNSAEWTPEAIGSAVGRPPEALRSVVRQLELHGLITDIGWQYANSSIKVRWILTDLGRALLTILKTSD
jgi:DNA-binding HxlR family transcriptional regulator